MLESLYPILLSIHNAWRWVALLGVLCALLVGVRGFFGRRPWDASAERTGRLAVLVMDVQLVLGVVLYAGVSPVTRLMFTNYRAAMKGFETRFFGMEHLSLMILAVALTHVAKVRASRLSRDRGKYRTGVMFYGATLGLMLRATPGWRPLLRWP